MIIAYQYRLKPNKEQIIAIESWLEKLRHQYVRLESRMFRVIAISNSGYP